MENPMADLKKVEAAILRKLETGELPATSGGTPNSPDKTPTPSSAPPDLQRSTAESLTERQRERRKVIMLEVVQRYIFDKKLDPLPDAVLLATVRSYDQLFTHAGVPTERIPEVYREAMAQHGQYLLKVDDYLRAWERIRPKEYAGVDTRPMHLRGSDCSICKGTGMAKIYVPSEDAEIEKECPYHCKVSTAISRV